MSPLILKYSWIEIYSFQLNGASENEDNASDEGEEEMNTTIKLYSLADVRVSESGIYEALFCSI